jgi:hypothetical protein
MLRLGFHDYVAILVPTRRQGNGGFTGFLMTLRLGREHLIFEQKSHR